MIGTEEQAKKKIRKANNVLDFNKRMELARKIEEGNKSQADLAREFDVDAAVLTRLKKNAAKVKGKMAKACGKIVHRKRLREGKFFDIDEKVHAWIKFMLERLSATKLPVSKSMIQLQAMKYANESKIENFRASNGWLNRFKDLYGLRNRNLHGEMGDVDMTKRWPFLKLNSLNL
jgi:hypothetical protein